MESNERTPLFTNTYVPREETDRQLYVSVRFVRRLVLFVFGALLMAYTAKNVVDLCVWAREDGTSVLSDPYLWVAVATGALCAFVIVREIFGPRIFAKKEKKRLTEKYGTYNIEIVHAFFDDGFESHNRASHAELRLAYTSIASVKRTKDLYILLTQEKQIIILDRAGFSGTDDAVFWVFLHDKCASAKMPA